VPKPRVKKAFDLVITGSGLRRKVIECRTRVYRCRPCGRAILPKGICNWTSTSTA